MPRTKGAKNKPKNPERELEKVKALYADAGLDFPYSEAKPVDKPADKPADTGNSEDHDTLKIIHPHDEVIYECGNCHGQMDKALPQCPMCGVGLNW